ncbi:MAG: MlaE family ABC transporter permease [Phycisphaerae bacterium]
MASSANPIRIIGQAVIGAMSYAGSLAMLLAAAARWLGAGLFVPGVRLGGAALAAQMVRVGIKSLGIVLLVHFFMGVVLALQLTPPLQEPYHQEAQIANIVAIAGFRMLAPIFTAIVLSGFAGASIAAELGTMVVTEEIEAMRAIALNPLRYLVMPRVVATAVMTVLLTVLADLTIVFGTWATARAVLSPRVYVGFWDRVQEGLKTRDFISGLVMALVFGVLISLIACREGLKVKGGAEGVGQATTMTVVYSIVAIISAAMVFTAVFYAVKV